jgi:N,N-dimethylformamidase
MVTITAYLDRMSAAPGETVAVKVGSYGAKTYRAELRRIIQGDTHPEGPGYRDELIIPDLCGERPARVQPILAGSYGRIDDRGGVLGSLRSFTIAVPVAPTRIGAEGSTVLHLMRETNAFELGLAPDGIPFATHGGVTARLATPVPLKAWTLLVASYDDASGILSLHAIDGSIIRQSSSTPTRSPIADFHGVIIACRAPGLHAFDGRIDSPVLFDRAIDPREAARLLVEPNRLIKDPRLVAYWDFSRGQETTAIHDASPHHLDGQLFQTPARAITGWRWRGETLDWRQRPDLYSAIHFHASDMTDAEWDTDFTFAVPETARSGIHAVRLLPDAEETNEVFAVFAVRPARDQPSPNSVCFLMPTASYLAYANHRIGLDMPGTEVGMGRLVEVDRHHAFLQEHPEFGYSFYEVHDDGSGVFHSSRNRPILDIQPKVKGFLGGWGSNVWQFNADTHITGWLEHVGQGYDVITDEDLHEAGLALLRRYRVVITGTHPEYHSTAMLDAIQGHLDRGGRLMYLGGNGFYWRISFSPQHPGVIECRRSEAGIRPWEPGPGQFHHAFTGEYGGLWRRNGRSSAALAGVVMSSQGFDVSEPYVLDPAARDPRVAFMFEGIDASPGRRFGAFGLSGGGAAGLEIDRADPSLGTPPHALVVGSSERHTDIYLMTPEDLLDPTPDWTGTQTDLVRADLTFMETPGGGAVLSAGSIAWAGAMAWNGYDNEVARLTGNVLRRFGNPDPFEMP